MDTFSVTGVVQGSGKIRRWSQHQPTFPGWTNCLNGPCVILAPATLLVIVEPTVATLRLDADPPTIVSGEQVKFEASANGQAVSVEAWYWVPDSIPGQPRTPDSQTSECTGTNPVCFTNVFRTGRMYVRARVGPQQIAEQTYVQITVQPIVLRAKAFDHVVVAGDFTTVAAWLVPPTPVSSVSIVGGPTCDSQLRCRIRVTRPETLTVVVTLQSGAQLSCKVTVDTLPCRANNPDIDQHSLRLAIDSLWKIGGRTPPASQRRERTAFIIDSAGLVITRYMPLMPGSTACTTRTGYEDLINGPGWTSGMKIMRQIHTHPFNENEPTPTNCGPSFGGQPAGRGPSAADWGNLTNILDYPNYLARDFRQVVVEPTRVWTMNVGPDPI